MSFHNPGPEDIKALLAQVKTIAVGRKSGLIAPSAGACRKAPA
ncbi:MAG: hypothetical protein Q8Q28_12125 [Pseudomonadota bacterium]|nr:hypothetical protein [Pseudomonadota bacterium]